MTVEELWHITMALKYKGHGNAVVLLDIDVGDQVARLAAADAVLVESLMRNTEVLCLRSYEERLTPKPVEPETP